jgi:hypothetical protein
MKNIFKLLVLFWGNVALVNAQTPCYIAKYSFNDGNIKDESGNGHDLTLVGATQTKNRFGNNNFAYHFNGNQYLWAVADTQFSKKEFSTSFWAKPESTSDARIITVGPPSTYWHYYCNVIAGGKYSWIAHDKNGNYNFLFSSTTAVQNNVWTHVVSTYKGDSAKIYLNGVLSYKGKISNPVITFNSNQILQIGAAYHPDKPLSGFIGDLDDISIYCNSLSATEVKNLYLEQNNPLNIGKEYQKNQIIKISPNPILGSNSELTIDYSLRIGTTLKVELLNNIGELIEEFIPLQGIGNSKIELNNITAGVYYIKLFDSVNGYSDYYKLIVL